MVHAQALGEQTVLRIDHVRVTVLRKSRLEPIARLRGFSVTDAVGQHDEVFRRVEELARAEQLAGEFRAQELRAGSTRAVPYPHGVAHDAFGVLLRLAERTVVQAQLRQRFAARELEVAQHEIALDGRGIVRGQGRRAQGKEACRESEQFWDRAERRGCVLHGPHDSRSVTFVA
jgi:hypothetical protein